MLGGKCSKVDGMRYQRQGKARVYKKKDAGNSNSTSCRGIQERENTHSARARLQQEACHSFFPSGDSTANRNRYTRKSQSTKEREPPSTPLAAAPTQKQTVVFCTWLRPSIPFLLILSGVGFRPQVPVKWHGMRMDPPTSLPSASGAQRDATRLASPPEDPPGVRPRSQGLSERPKTALSLSGSILPVPADVTLDKKKMVREGGENRKYILLIEVMMEVRWVDDSFCKREMRY